jgi:hypothetical protein
LDIRLLKDWSSQSLTASRTSEKMHSLPGSHPSASWLWLIFEEKVALVYDDDLQWNSLEVVLAEKKCLSSGSQVFF